MLRHFTFVAFLFLITSTASFAQSDFKAGYVVLLQGDTVSGFLDDRGDVRNAQRATFRASADAEKKSYLPTDITSYQVGSRIYRAAQVIDQGQPQAVFLELINDGNLRLLYWKDSKDKDHLYVQKAEAEPQELTNEKKKVKQNGKAYIFYARAYVNTLNALTADCGGPATESLRYNLKAIASYVGAYNTCKGGEAYSSAKPAVKASITKSVYAGLNHSEVVTAGNAKFSETNSRTGLNAGIGFHVNFPNRKFHFDLLAEYNRKGAEAEKERINFDLHYLNVSPGIGYVYPKGRLKPMLGAGFVAGYLLNSKASAYTRTSYEKQIRLFDSMTDNSEVAYEVGYEGRAGVKYALANDLQLLLKIRFARTLVPFSFRSSTYHNHVFSLQAGMEF